LKPEIVVSAFVILFVVLVMAGAVVFLVMEASDKLDTLREKAPWFVKLIERRESLNVLLAVCLFMLLGNGYELIMKEVPEVPAPPVLKLPPPPAPEIKVDNPKVITRTLPPPEQPLHVSTAEYGVSVQNERGQKISLLLVLGITNKPITPIDALLQCGQDFTVVSDIHVGVGGAYMTQKIERVTGKSYRLGLQSPAWTPTQPLGVFVSSENSVDCKISLQ
jgi:hypothetical protein